MSEIGNFLTIPVSQAANTSPSAILAQRRVTDLALNVTSLPAAAAGEVRTLLSKMLVFLELRPADGEPITLIGRIPMQILASYCQLNGQESYVELDELIADAGATAVRGTYGCRIPLGQIILSKGDELYLEVDIGTTAFGAAESVRFSYVDDPQELIVGEQLIRYYIWDQPQNKVQGLLEAYAVRRDISGGLSSENSQMTPTQLAFLMQGEDARENSFDAYDAMGYTLAMCQGFNPPKDVLALYRDRTKLRCSECQTITLSGTAAGSWSTMVKVMQPSPRRANAKAHEAAQTAANQLANGAVRAPDLVEGLYASSAIPHPGQMVSLTQQLAQRKAAVFGRKGMRPF